MNEKKPYTALKRDEAGYYKEIHLMQNPDNKENLPPMRFIHGICVQKNGLEYDKVFFSFASQESERRAISELKKEWLPEDTISKITEWANHSSKVFFVKAMFSGNLYVAAIKNLKGKPLEMYLAKSSRELNIKSQNNTEEPQLATVKAIN